MKKRHLLVSLMTLVLCLTLISGATFALFTSESKVNIAVTSGKVEIEASVKDITLYSMGVEQTGTFENGGTALFDGGLLTLSNITPGDKVNFTVKVDNKSNVNTIWRFVWECSEGTELMSYMNVTIDSLEAGAIKSHKSAWEVLDAAGDEVKVSMELPVQVGNEAQDLTTKVSFKVEAVQANGAAVDTKYTETAETVYIEGYASEEVEVEGNAVKEEVELSANGYEAIVPAGTILEDGAQEVSLNVETADANTGNYNFSVNGVETIGLNISIPEVADNNTTPIIVKLENIIESLAADETLFMYHEGVPMNQVASVGEVDAANEFYYDAATGDIIFATVNFSNFTIAKAKYVKVSTKAELEAAASKGKYVVLANDIELSKTLALKKDIVIDLNGYTISAGFTSSKLIQVYDQSNANVIITSSKEGAQLNVAGNGLILNYGNVEFSNVAINVGEIKSSSYQTFSTYGNLKLGEGAVVNVQYLGTSVISANGACEVVLDGAVINVETFVVNWSSFISKANATVLTINEADINIESLGNEKYPAYSYFISNNLLVTINECNFDVNLDGKKYVAVNKDDKYRWVKAVSTLEELQAAIDAEEEIILAKDIEVSADVATGITVAKGKKAVIDLNGYNITCDSEIAESVQLFSVSGELTIKGNGKISLTNKDYAWTESYRYTAINIRETGVVTLEDGVEVVCTAGENDQVRGYGMAYAVDIYTTGVLNVNGSKLHSNYIAVRCFFGDSVVNVNAGSITSSRNNFGIWLQSSPNAKVNIAEGIEYELNEDYMIYIFK